MVGLTLKWVILMSIASIFLRKMRVCTERTDALSGFRCLLTSPAGPWSRWAETDLKLGWMLVAVIMVLSCPAPILLQTALGKAAEPREATLKPLEGSCILFWGGGLGCVSRSGSRLMLCAGCTLRICRVRHWICFICLLTHLKPCPAKPFSSPGKAS